MMGWYTGGGDLGWLNSHAEFWVGEQDSGELVLVASTLDFMPSAGMYITYQPLVGEKVTHRVGDVYVSLKEAELQVSDSPNPAYRTFIRPTIVVELQEA
jgi:hypothetical protein